MLLVEQCLLDFFAKKPQADITELKQTLAETLSSNGKSVAIVDRAIEVLPFIVINN